jgi:hypothetical protein
LATAPPEDTPTRYGNILLLAPALKALTQLLIENMTLTKLVFAENGTSWKEKRLMKMKKEEKKKIMIMMRMMKIIPQLHLFHLPHHPFSLPFHKFQ